METLVVLFIVGVIVVVVGGALGGAALFVKDEKRGKLHEAVAAETCAELFSGADQVVYKAPDSSGGLDLGVLVTEANKHGYRMVQETGQMATRRVVFERV